jgi:hypothetical protein
MNAAIEGAFIVVMGLLTLLGIATCIGKYFKRKQRRELLPEPADEARRWQEDFERYLDQR